MSKTACAPTEERKTVLTEQPTVSATDIAVAVAEFSRDHHEDGDGRIWPCFVGDSGVGKTARARAMAERLGCEHVEVVLLGTEMPHDVLGLPRVRGDVARLCVAERWLRAAEQPTLVFLDELDKADRDCAAAVLTLLNDMHVHGLRLHPRSVVVAAMQPPDLALWREDTTFRALAARLCFVGVGQAEAWRHIQHRTGVDLSAIYGCDEAPPLPLLPKPTPRQALWLTRFAQHQPDPLAPVVRAVASGIVASPQAIEEHLRAIADAADPRFRIAVLARDENVFLRWISEIASLADLILPATIEAIFKSPSQRPFLAAFQRLWTDGSDDDRTAFLSGIDPVLTAMSEEQGTPGQVEVFGDHDAPEVAGDLVRVSAETARIVQARKTAAHGYEQEKRP
jgi:hypothetical protein